MQSIQSSAMNPEERIVTWLISLGVLDSPKKTICDPEEFLKSSLKNGVVLCKLLNRLRPGSLEKVREMGSLFGIAYHQSSNNVALAMFCCPGHGTLPLESLPESLAFSLIVFVV